MTDARAFATNVVGAAIAVMGAAFLLVGVWLAATGRGFLAGLLVGGIGLVVLVVAWGFLLVPFKVDELEEAHAVHLDEQRKE